MCLMVRSAGTQFTHWKDDPHPFAWSKTVDDIITKVKRGRATLDRFT